MREKALLSSVFGQDLPQPVLYVIAFVIIFALLALLALVLRRLTGGRLTMTGGDRARTRQPRLGIVDVYDLDRQRQLILLRRDNVEHLLLIGGPNDLMVETNIVRVAGARLPGGATDVSVERQDVLDRPPEPPAARPTIEGPPRPLPEPVRRPEVSRAPEPVGARPDSAPSPLLNGSDPHAEREAVPGAPRRQGRGRMEPVLKPDGVEAAPRSGAEPPTPVREPARPVQAAVPANAARPAEPSRPPSPVVNQPRSAAVETRPAERPAAPARPREPSAVPPTVRVSEAPDSAAVAPEGRTADPAVLSDMARQLEEALRRPAAPAKTAEPQAPVAQAAPRPPASNPAPTPPAARQVASPEPARRPTAPDGTEPAPARQAAPVRPPAPPEPPRAEPPRPAPKAPEPDVAAEPAEKVSDPFSVDDIEAEFARLLGRPLQREREKS